MLVEKKDTTKPAPAQAKVSKIRQSSSSIPSHTKKGKVLSSVVALEDMAKPIVRHSESEES